MRAAIKKMTTKYGIILFFIIGFTGLVLIPIVDNYFMLFAVLSIEYVILLLILRYLFDKYVKPIEVITETVDKHLQGNYSARVRHSTNNITGELSMKINTLARNLSELSIHEQIQAEQLSTVIENSESGLLLIDEKGYIHFVNRIFRQMFGKQTADYIGNLYYRALDNEAIHKIIQETFLYENHVKDLLKHTISGEKRYLEVIGAPIFNEVGLLKGVVLVVYDISDLKNLEKMRKDFVANVSHELKTPITSIKGFAETLLDGAADDRETLQQFLTIMLNESNRIEYLINDLLTISRLERDELELNIVPASAQTMVDELLPLIEQHAKDKNINLHFNVAESLEIYCDRDKMKQVILNLLLNGINYTQVNGEVTLAMISKEDYIEITVTDNGIGIEDKYLPRLFERFYRVDKARSRDSGGTGLGLSIVKHIIEAHKGTIAVTSKVDEGSTFTVTIPQG